MLGSDVVHPGIGLVVLFVDRVLNVYKLRGMTRYGLRNAQAVRWGRGHSGVAGSETTGCPGGLTSGPRR